MIDDNNDNDDDDDDGEDDDGGDNNNDDDDGEDTARIHCLLSCAAHSSHLMENIINIADSFKKKDFCEQTHVLSI